MSRHDPTLSADLSETPESDLIARVKTDADSAALLTLISRHTGIYFGVVNRYAAAYPNAIKARDLDDDKLFNIYTFVQAFDPTRGMKLSTYICDRTDYLCKTLLKRDERNPLSPGTYAATGSMPIDSFVQEGYSSTYGQSVALEDQSSASRVVDTANTDIGIETIRTTAAEVCEDKRFLEILEYRHLNASQNTLSWRQIGARMSLSHEACRKVYYHNLELVKAHLSPST